MNILFASGMIKIQIFLFAVYFILWLLAALILKSDYFAQTKERSSGLFFLWLIQFITILFHFGFSFSPELYLSVIAHIDRASILVSFLWIIWFFGVPYSNKRTTFILGIVTLIIMGLSIGIAFAFPQLTQIQPINGTWMDWGWGFLSLGILLLGIGFIWIRKKKFWGIGIICLSINLLLGFSHLFFFPISENDPILMTASLAISFPCLLIFLLNLSRKKPESGFHITQSIQSVPETTQSIVFENHFELLALWLELVRTNSWDELLSGITRILSTTMTADIGLVLGYPDSEKNIVIHTGYDLIRKQKLDGFSVEEKIIPTIASFMRRGEFLQDTGSEIIPERALLAPFFGLKNTGPILFCPISTSEKIWGGILLLAPHSHRVWEMDDLQFLQKTILAITPLIENPPIRPSSVEPNLDELIETNKKLNQSQKEITELKTELEYLYQQIQGLHDKPLNDKELSIQQIELEASRKENEKLKKQILDLQSVRNLHQTETQIESELRLTLEEVARLQNALASANMKILSLQPIREENQTRSNEQDELLAAITQDFKEPLSTILGYSELLLSENSESLSQIQRKYIENIHLSVDRLRSIYNDLTQIRLMHGGKLETIIEAVNIYDVIDQAIASVRIQFKEKGLSIQFNILEDLPAIFTDQDSFLNCFTTLLRTAGEAASLDGIITIRLNIQKDSALQDKVCIFKLQFPISEDREDDSEILSDLLELVQPFIDQLGSKVRIENIQPQLKSIIFELPFIPARMPGAESDN